MRPLLQHAQHSFFASPQVSIPKPLARSFSNALRSVVGTPSVCLQCQNRGSVAFRSSRSSQWPLQLAARRGFHEPSDGGKPKPKEDETPEERLARVQADIALRERQEKARLEKERLEKERQEKERQEREKRERERWEKQRLERERQEKERERLEKERQATTQNKSSPNVIELSAPNTHAAPKAENKMPDAAELSASGTVPPPKEVRTHYIRKEPLKESATKEDIERVPADQLPSHHHAQRWGLIKRFQDFMDDILPKLAVVTQKVNTFTGTDYSGIEALKREIKEQEKLVKTRRIAIDEAKQALDDALSKQASSQKEVVALLERKHSWTDTDLERYMSLIRSEHINEQAVREAKDAIAQAENALEEARSQLEKRERAQYHEEQIWSDTIRRNSTWVTFGLMGLNIFLLLATMVVIEPWRRRRMVREIKNALEAQNALATATQAVATAPLAAAVPAIAVEAVKEAQPTEPVSVQVDTASPTQQDPVVPEVPATTEPAPVTPELPAELVIVEPVTPAIPIEEAVPLESLDIEEEVRGGAKSTFEAWQAKVTYIANDIFSERTVSMRRVDYTAHMFQAAAAGAVITAAIVAMIVGR